MSVSALRPLSDFGVRSIVTHAFMALAGLGAIGSWLLLETGTLQQVSVVAFINFAAGLWISQAVHSLGNSYTDDDYNGVLMEILEYVS
jgi:hypothetical protein